MKITFLGAAKTVTGSKYLLQVHKKRYLIDCGLFQGYKELRLRNWEKFPVDPSTIDAILLTHAHIDHSGYIPRLVKEGFRGRIYCTPTTQELCSILLLDSAHLQEEDARHANTYHYAKHTPALPLYTKEDAENALKLFTPIDFEQPHTIDNHLVFTFYHAGHILGAAFISLAAEGKQLLFSGDIGRLRDPVMKAPHAPTAADYLIVESTYGNRLHEQTDPTIQIKDIVNRTAARGGSILIPAFAVGRTQTILYYLSLLKHQGEIPDLPIYIDSPMATSATTLFCQYRQELRLSNAVTQQVCDAPTFIRTVEESMALDTLAFPSIIISASGMATGGRVLHHLKVFLPKHQNTVLLAGFQAEGTRGDKLERGEKEITIHGQVFPVRAEVKNLSNISAHADYSEILEWLKPMPTPPRKVFITHGEEGAAESLKEKIEGTFGWEAIVPDYLQSEQL